MMLRPWSQPLRAWQRDAVGWWARVQPASSLAVVTPGGGKSLYAAAIAYGALAGGLVDGILVVVPSDHLRSQMAMTFAGVGMQLDPYFKNSHAEISRDVRGAVVTIHQVAQDVAVFARLVRRRRVLVVIDEVHHAGSNQRWGAAVQTAFAGATHIVALSGTPFRSDGGGISFLSYDAAGRVEADVVYGYRDALRDRIVRPVVFHRQGAEATWTGADGTLHCANFDEPLDKQRSSERLRAALTDRAWVCEVIARAHDQLDAVRRTDPRAGGLVVCMDEAHARWVAQILADVLGVRPIVVVSADTAAGAKIRRFTRSADPWLCAVRMVSEGVDIPRATVLAYLTNIKTELFFRQMIGRVVRTSGTSPNPSHVLLPDDPELRSFASAIEADVQAQRDEQPVGMTRQRIVVPSTSRFEGHDVLHQDRGTLVGASSAAAIAEPSDGRASSRHGSAMGDRPVGGALPALDDGDLIANRKADLRRMLWRKVTLVARRFRKEPRDVYAYWRRRDGAPVSQASEVQLAARLRTMDRWLSENFCPIG